MDEFEALKEFNETCFALNNTQKKLTDAIMNNIDTFTLNPEIQKITNEIKELKKRKENLKAILKEEQNGKENNE